MSTRTELLADDPHEVAHGVAVAHVELAGDDAATAALDLVGGGVEVLDVAVAHGNVRAEPRDASAIASPMPAAAPVTIGDAVGEEDGGRFEGHGEERSERPVPDGGRDGADPDQSKRSGCSRMILS